MLTPETPMPDTPLPRTFTDDGRGVWRTLDFIHLSDQNPGLRCDDCAPHDDCEHVQRALRHVRGEA